MSTVADIKRFILRILATFAGQPVKESELIRVVNDGFTRKPLLSDVKDAIRELEAGEFIQGAADDLEPDARTWSLTTKGAHKAKQLS
jgi:hypothetical protein